MSPSPRLAAATALAFLALPAAFLAGCGKSANGAAPAASPPPIQVATVKVKSQPVPVSLEAVGQAEGSREVEIRARVTGILEKRLYDEGATVAAGSSLFLLDAAPYELAMQQAKASLLEHRARRELAETEAERLAPLAGTRAIPQREVDQALANAKTAAAAVAAAEARLEEAELNLSYTKIAAPMSGVTGRALRSEGSLVTANTDSALLTTLTQVNPIWVRFSLAEADFARVRGNERKARVQVLAEDGSVSADDGRLNFAGSTVDPKLGAVQMRAEFPNADRRWLPGQFVKLRILAGEQMAMLVPQGAILPGEQSRSVLTIGADGKALAKPVQVAGWHGTDTIVVSGLAEGDAVIVDNLVKVRPGTAVQARAPSPQPPPKGGGAK